MLQAKIFDMCVYLMRLQDVVTCMSMEQKENITPGCARILEHVTCGIQKTISIGEGSSIDPRKEWQRISTEIGALRLSKYLKNGNFAFPERQPATPNLNDEGEWNFFKLANAV